MLITITTKTQEKPQYVSASDFPICTVGYLDNNRLVLKVVTELFFFDTQTYVQLSDVKNVKSHHQVRMLYPNEVINLKIEG
jgi:hypothetical protein